MSKPLCQRWFNIEKKIDGCVEAEVSDGLQSRPNRSFRMKHHIVYEQALAAATLEAIGFEDLL